MTHNPLWATELHGAQGREAGAGRNHVAMLRPSYFISVSCLLPTFFPSLSHSIAIATSSIGTVSWGACCPLRMSNKGKGICVFAYKMHLNTTAVLHIVEGHKFAVSKVPCISLLLFILLSYAKTLSQRYCIKGTYTHHSWGNDAWKFSFSHFNPQVGWRLRYDV